MSQTPSKKLANLDLFESLPGKPLYYYLATYAAMTIAIFYKTIFAFSKLIYGTDLMAGNLFFRHFLIDFFRSAGTWPLWDPFIHGGMPFMEAIHGDIFYVPSLIFYMLFGVDYAWGFLFALHTFFAGFFMYLFLKELDIRGKVAFLGGVLYMMAPVMLSLVYAGHNGKFFVIALAPLLFFVYQRAINRNKLGYYLFLSFVMFLIMASPHMQLAYFLFFVLAIYFVATIVQRWKKNGAIPIRPITLFIAASIIGGMLSLVQFLAPYQYLQKYSMRTERNSQGKGFDYSTSWAMSWEELASDFFPEFSGDDVSGQKQTYWGRNPFKLNSEHFSIIAIFLSIFAIGLWKRPGKWFFFWTAILTALFALGASTPLFRLFYLLPGIRSFRAPSLISFMTAFSVITLGAMGLKSFLESKAEDKKLKKTWKIYTYICIGYSVVALLIIILQMAFFKIWFAIFSYTPEQQKLETLRQSLDSITIGAVISLVFIWILYGLAKLYTDKKVKSNMVVIALSAMAFVYMWSFNSRYIIPIDPNQYYAKTPIVDFFKSKLAAEGPFRVFVLPQSLPDYYLAYHHIEELSLTALHGNQLATFDKLAGSHGNIHGLVYPAVQDLLNAKYVISTRPMPPQRFHETTSFGGLKVFENMTALPRAFPVYRYQVVPDEDKIVAALYDTTFDYRSQIMFESTPPNAPPPLDASKKLPVVPARIYDSRNWSFKVDVDMLEDGFLFLSENYYPPWKTYENGQLLPTLKADVAFRAIPLKKGKHTLECKFENGTLTAAARISGFTFILLILASIGLGIQYWRNRKKMIVSES